MKRFWDVVWLAGVWLGVAVIAVLALASLIYVSGSCHLCT